MRLPQVFLVVAVIDCYRFALLVGTDIHFGYPKIERPVIMFIKPFLKEMPTTIFFPKNISFL